MKETINLNYITIPSWWDTDVTLIPSLIKETNIKLNLIVLVPYSDSKFSISEIQGFCLKHGINFSIFKRKHKIRHISNLNFAFKILVTLNKNKSAWIFFEYFADPYLNTLLLLKKKKTIISFHNYKEHSSLNAAPFEAFFKRLFIKRFNFFHLHSLNQKSHFINENPLKKAFYTTMPLKDYGKNNIDIEKDNKIEFLFFGYIQDYKNLSALIIAFENLNRNDVRLTIAGNCKDFEKYDRLIKTEELYNKQIRFIENKEIPYFFSTANFLVLPYKDATQSGPLLIAMNYNLPIIASDIEPFNTIIDNSRNGILFNTDDDRGLINAINTACNLNDIEYNDMKDNFQKTINKYQLKVNQNSQRFLNFLNSN